MAVLEITEFPEKVLKQVGEPVEEFGAELEKLVSDMFETMYKEEGVGLAAPQVGLSLRLFVMDCEGLKLVAANPEIVSAEGEQEGEEGCLSVGFLHETDHCDGFLFLDRLSPLRREMVKRRFLKMKRLR
jgi:peptide deformylase